MTVWQGKYGPLLIAEIGGNHHGNFDYAKRLTDLAIGSGADYIKFQLYTGDTLVSRSEGPDRNAHFKKFELTQEMHIHLAETCRAAGVGYMASVWNSDFMDWIDPYMPIYKVGSGDMTAYPVLAKVAARKKPIILSTGLSTLDEVVDAVAFLQKCDARYASPEYLALLQCTSMYPIANYEANLLVMDTLRKVTGLTVGYSDHTEGMQALIVATAMGAEILEFHFTDTREGQTFRDHKVSLTQAEVQTLQKELLAIRELRGDGVKVPLECETDHRISFRRAIYPARDLPAGTQLTDEDLTCLRPNHGIDAREYWNVLGKFTTVPLKAHQKLEWQFLSETPLSEQ
ncbi:MAG TPA: N-acetylneuraminate synthase family protein [Anaerolineales bacterium]|nr:N-acetylneuraminate synthase family protein [Anaerolineales bacterium]